MKKTMSKLQQLMKSLISTLPTNESIPKANVDKNIIDKKNIEYKDAVIIDYLNNGVVMVHSAGINLLKFNDLPEKTAANLKQIHKDIDYSRTIVDDRGNIYHQANIVNITDDRILISHQHGFTYVEKKEISLFKDSSTFLNKVELRKQRSTQKIA